MAREVGAIVVGVVVGYVTGSPQLGFLAASLVYGATAPNAKQEGPRLTDLKAPQAAYGTVIPYIEGSPRTAGIYVWYSDKREVANESTSGGKGGPGVDTTLFTYEMDALIMFSINQLAGIRRAYANGKLFWSMADDADSATLDASETTTYWKEFRFYPGGSTQLPDPDYETAVGIGNAPAYRERATLFIKSLNLGQSGQLPVLTFEVLSAGTTSIVQRIETLYTATMPYANTIDIGGSSYVSVNGHTLYRPGFSSAYENRTLFQGLYVPGNVVNFVVAPDLPNLGNSTGFLQGMANEDYWMGSGLGGNVGSQSDDILTDSLGGTWVGLIASSFARYGGQTLLLLNGLSPYTTYPRGLTFNGTAITATAYTPRSAALLGVIWYVLPAANDGFIYKYDASLVAAGTIADPRPGSGGTLVRDEVTGELYLHDGTNLRKWSGTVWSTVLSSLPVSLVSNTFPTGVTITNGTLAVLKTTASGSGVPLAWTVTTIRNRSTVAPIFPTLDQVVSRLCLRTGLLVAGDIDVTSLASDVVKAFAISQVTPTRQAIEILMAAYLFEAVASDKIKFVKRGGASVLSIPFADLGAGHDDRTEILPVRRLNDMELPAWVTVKYANITNDYQDGSESGDRLVTRSKAVAVVELPLGFTPSEAKKVADASTMDLAVSLIGLGPASVTRKYPQLEPTDVVTLTDFMGSTYRARIMKITNAEGIITSELVLDDATVINSLALTDSSYAGSSLVRHVSVALVDLLDIPILRDVDDTPGFYAGFYAPIPRPGGASLYKSSDNVTFTRVVDTTDFAVRGAATTTLGPWTGGWVFDEVNSLTVNVGDGTLASVTRDVLLSSTGNAMLVGSEVIQYRDAVLVSAGVYTLTGLLRGRRGTEWAQGGHVAAERVVALGTSTGIRRVLDQQADIGVSKFWKPVSVGRTIASAIVKTFTDTGVSEKPFSPVDLRKSGDTSSVIVSWKRRTRYAPRFTGLAGINVPLGETSESYQVELRNASNVLVSTDIVGTPTWATSSASISGGLQAPAWGLATISGELVGIRDDVGGNLTTNKFLIRFDTAGLQVAQSPMVGQEVYQWTNAADELYVATAEFNQPSGSYKNGKVQRVTRTALGTIAATYTAATAGDPAGVAYDGTNVWMTERLGGNLRKLNATTLASIATYVITSGAGMGALYHDSGALWICSTGTSEIVKWDIATTAEVLRFSVVGSPFDLMTVGSLVFVLGSAGLGVYNKTTGALIGSVYANVAPSFLAQRELVLFGSYVAVGGLFTVSLFDSTTGAFVRSVNPLRPYFQYVSGAYGSTLYLTVGAPGVSWDTKGYVLSAPALTGYSLTVYQRGASGMLGYPATLGL